MNRSLPVPAKVTRPTLPDIFARKRLFNLLDDSRKRPIIWVSGPPGCGKTTLLGSYIESLKIPCLWYNLDEGDSDPATFFYYMGLAAKKTAPRMRNSLPLLTPEYLPGISTFTRRYFENLCDRIKKPGFIVFDNYHEVSAEAAIHEVIRTGLSVISEGINVILISRGKPHSGLVRLKANRKMQSVGWDQLRFTLEESRELLQFNNAKNRLSKETIEALHRTTDGWAAGLVLMMETARGKVFEPRQINAMTQQDIFSYFANELFDKTDERIQAFLLKTSFLPEMTHKMAEELTGQTNAGRILSRLNQTHFFTEKRSLQKEPVYQYHPLFRGFLLEKAAIALSPEKTADLRHRAAVILEEGGQIEAAVTLYRGNENWEEMIRLIMRQAPVLLKQGRNIILEKWLTGISLEIFEKNPWLNYWMGLCCFPVNPSRSQYYLEVAFEQFNEQGDASGTFLAWSGMVEAIAFDNEDLQRLDRWIKELENRMDEYFQLPSEEIKPRVTNSMFIALKLRRPQHPEMENWAEKILLQSQKEANVNIKAMSLFNLAHHRIMKGELDKAASILYDLNRLAESPVSSPLTRLRAKFTATVYYQANGGYAECLKAMKEGLEISKKTGVHVWDPWLLAFGAAAAMNHCDYQTAGRLLEKMGPYLDKMKPWEMSGYHFLKARGALIIGNLEKASVHAKLSLKLAKKAGVLWNWCWPVLLKAQIMHRLHNYKEANEDLTLAFTIAYQKESNLFKFHALMIEAQFAYDRGKPVDGLKALRKALALGKDQKYLNIFADHPVVTANLCVRALEAGIEVEYAQEIIRRRQLIPSDPPVHLENWPWALKIFTLGRFGLVRDGKPLRFTRKAQEKPLTLLKALIAFGGREIGEERLADALWPEADGDLAHKSFATTLWRLRKLFGYPDAIQLSDRRLTLDARYCWVDVWAFERLIRQAESAWKQTIKENELEYAASLIQNALDIYQGPFLASETNAYWTISVRERLQNRFLRTLKRLCKFWDEIGEHEKALECFQRSLEVDDLDEEAYQAIMSCYWQLGRRAAALSLYERCKETLSTKFGIEPSEKTESLRKALLSNSNPMN